MSCEIENVLAALDDFRMCDQIDYAAYSQLHDLISELDVPDRNDGKWISVKDRLPELDQEVFVFTNGLIRVYSLLQVDTETADVCWEDDYGYFHEVDEVTHWKPLLKPPKEE